jgi:Brp/Blh family beta-carotene 15,15'-monooxygenase
MAQRRSSHAAPTPPRRETFVFAAAAGLALLWIALGDSADGSSAAAVLVLVLAVALIGLPHGGLDAWLALRSGLCSGSRQLVLFHLLYVVLAAAVALLWLWLPTISLLGFLLISGWHFGGDWPGLPAPMRGLAGVALLGLPAWYWAQPVAALFEMLAGAGGLRLAASLSALGPLFALLLAAAVVSQYRRPLAALELALLSALALLAPPLLFFGVYFCTLHSPRQLRLSLALAAPPQRRRLLGVAAAYAALSVALVLLAGYFAAALSGRAQGWLAQLDAGDGVRLLFIGLAALTVPHMLVAWRAARLLERAP